MRVLLIGLPALFAISIPASSSPVPSTASRNIDLGKAPILGVNLSGCEFADNGVLCPTPATVRTYLAKGFKAFRLPFRGRQATDPAVVARIKAAVDAASAGGAYTILDRHDYGATFDPDAAAWWGQFIRSFPDSDHVMIDTMNEPKVGAPYEKDAVGTSYATQVNAGIAAFRRAGFKHRLLIEWRSWSGMQLFDKHEADGLPCKSAACSFDRAGGLKDPLGRTMLSGHRYPDQWGAGTLAACVLDKTGTELVANAEKAAIQRNLKIWIGEFAFGRAQGISTPCKVIGKDLLQHIRALPATYAGISWWGGGPAWKENYIYRIEPANGTFATASDSSYLKMITGR